jgi:hypothetical protein
MEVRARFLMWFPEPVPACCRERTGTGSGNHRAGEGLSGCATQVIAIGRVCETTGASEVEQSRIEGRFAHGA